MTNKSRKKECLRCGRVICEPRRASDAEWSARMFCSRSCNSQYHADQRRVDINDRFKSKYLVDAITGCWEWIGSKDDRGYGTISNRLGSGRSPEKAHRVSYEIHIGPIPIGLNVCHKCDNPGCVNPEHLFAGSQKDNMRDCSSKGRLNNRSFLNLRPGKKGFRGAGPKSNKELSK